jgi:hypothetical protein
MSSVVTKGPLRVMTSDPSMDADRYYFTAVITTPQPGMFPFG